MAMTPTVTFNGNYPVHGCKFEMDLNDGQGATPQFVEVIDLESIDIGIDTGVQTWNPLDQNGWQAALATTKALTIGVSGKRNVGDPGNDHLANKLYATGRDCDAAYRITFPNADTLSGKAVASANSALGASGDVAGIGMDLISNGQPTFAQGTV